MSAGGLSKLDDERLVARARDGSQAAMLELYHRYRGLILGYVMRMTGNRELADEVFAATFTAFFTHLPGYRAQGRLAGYLLRIARSQLANEQRARARLGRHLSLTTSDSEKDCDPVGSDPEPGETVARAELAQAAESALCSLSEPLREVVVLRLYEDLDYAQIAEIVGAGEATVRSRMRYALQALRHALNAANET